MKNSTSYFMHRDWASKLGRLLLAGLLALSTTSLQGQSCVYTFTLEDSFGDGWNGGEMEVQQNGVTVATLDLPSGSGPLNVPVTLDDGDDFDLVWTACGAYEGEIIVSIQDANGDFIFSFGPNEACTAGATIFSGTTNCVPPPACTGSECDYTFILEDSFGDGWNGGQMQVRQNGQTEAVLNLGSGFGPLNVSVTLCSAFNIDLVWSSCGFYPEEMIITVLNASGTEIFSLGPNATCTAGSTIFSGPVMCPTCIAPNTLTVTYLSATSVDVGFSCTGCTGTYALEYGAVGFTPGTGAGAGAGGTIITGASSPITVSGLSASQSYDIYVRQNCGANGFSTNGGPVKVLPGENCVNVLNLATLTSPFLGNTAGYTDNFTNTCAFGNTSPDMIFYLDVPEGVTLVIGQTENGYDSENTLFYGGACPGTTPIACYDDPDIQNTTWLNNTGAAQRVWWVQDGFSSSSNFGTYTLAWTLTVSQNCPAPSGLIVGSPTSTTANLTWTPGGGCTTSGEYWVLPAPSNTPTIGTGTSVPCPAVFPVNVTGLTANTEYDVYVYENCGVSGTAGPVVVGTFLTPNPPMPCNISGIGATNISACNPQTNTFTADVIVQFSNPPLLGTLELSGDATASVPVASLSGPNSHNFSGIVLPADGSALTFTAAFSADANCTMTNENAGTAPAACACELVINEVDYDQPGTDNAEFVELYNPCGSEVSLIGYTLQLVNGNAGGAAIYQTVTFASGSVPAGGYYVICLTGSSVPNCNLATISAIQNGAPDAVGLRLNGVLVDAVSYEGNTGAPFTEGSGTGLVDDGVTANQGISRVPNGIDTDMNNVDFVAFSITPGAANGGCPVQTTYYADTDMDGFGNPAVSQMSCTQPVGFVENDDDCNDNNAAIKPGATEICDGVDNDCEGGIDEGLTFDLDGDGFTSIGSCGGTHNDCNDNNSGINPAATEVCNGLDDDCDGQTDEAPAAPITWYRDLDMDGFGNPAVTTVACTPPTGFVGNDDDCNDNNAAIKPGATEVCDGVDNDCDGLTDEGVQLTFYRDFDMDGFGNLAITQMACTAPTGFVANNLDCNDNNAAIKPGATEVCDGVDNDCDGLTDEGVQLTFYRDFDGDGFGNAAITQMACTAPTGFVANNLDCNDNNAAIKPGATEVCNGLDDDCDGLTDEGVQLTFYRDFDGDGFGNAAITQMACTAPTGFVANNLDCNDNNAAIKPGATEVCNGLDDDCDGLTDEAPASPITWYRDFDVDGFGNPAITTVACTPPTGFVANDDDCNDNNAAIKPGATEVCDGVDNDCDGLTDEGVQLTFYRDFDGDGFGNAAITQMACTAPTGFVANDDDCNDNVNAINPNANEVCDGVDNDCDGTTDQNPDSGPTWYRDLDTDGFGNPNVTLIACSQPTGYVSNSLDCNDNNAAIKPTAPELCNGIDDDCDGMVDEFATNAPTWYRDLDGDGFGNVNVILVQCTQPAGYVANLLDCNDNNPNINPNTVWYVDFDGDGFGNPNSSVTTCNPGTGYVLNNGDCNDNIAAVNPNATEICNNLDDDCDGQVDEGVKLTFYRDLDGDGFGNAAISQMACTAPSGFVANDDDCNDNNFNIKPSANEVCDGMDNDCDGLTDEGVTTTFYADTDGDTFGNPNNTIQACSLPTGYVTNNDDCDDTDENVNPDATEICDNATDDNCDGQVDEGCSCTITSLVVSNISDCDDNDSNDPFDDTFTADVTLVFSNVPATGSLNLTGDGSASVPVSGISGNTHTFTGVEMTADATAIQLTASFSADGGCTITDNNAGIAPAACSGTCEIVILGTDTDEETCPGLADGSILINAVGSGQLAYSIDGGNSFNLSGEFNNLAPGTYNILVWVLGDPTCEAESTATVLPADPESLKTWYKDWDDDGYSDGNTQQACERPFGYKLASELIATSGDCNDYDATENVPKTWYRDADNDGWSNGTTIVQCLRPNGYKMASELTGTTGDCNDSNAAIHPGVTDTCNGIDDDCDGMTDEDGGGGTFNGNVTLNNQAQVDAFSQCYSVINGNLTIQNSTVNDLSNLINIVEVTGYMLIKSTSLGDMDGLDNLATVGGYFEVKSNNSLTTLSGLEGLATVGGNLKVHFNNNLTDCCAIWPLIDGGGVGGTITIFRNKTGCDNPVQVETACAGSDPLAAPAPGSSAVIGVSPPASLAPFTFDLYPNPVRSELNIRLLQAPEMEGRVTVFNLLGQAVSVHSLAIGQVALQVDMTGLQSGEYFIRVSTEAGTHMKQFLLQK